MLEHLKIYQSKTKSKKYEFDSPSHGLWSENLFCRYRVYRHDLEGVEHSGIILQDTRTGTVELVLEQNVIADLEEVTWGDDRKPWNPKPARIGEWTEMYYFGWRKGEQDESWNGELMTILPYEKEVRNDYLMRVAFILDKSVLVMPEEGHIYRARQPKRVARIMGDDEIDDRVVLHVGSSSVQIDSPTVKYGSHHPKIPLAKFLAWMGTDVTAHYEKNVKSGEWDIWDKRKDAVDAVPVQNLDRCFAPKRDPKLHLANATVNVILGTNLGGGSASA